MIFEVEYTIIAKESLAKFKKSNPMAYKKVIALIDELHIHPRTGRGHPKPLVGGNSVTYSRAITKKDRLVYDIYENEERVEVLYIESHYGDK
jgi:toxin YoeB